jgi:hypothetical protein
MIALDFVSLLLSKDAPVQASTSMSPALREAAGMGTLGADKTQASRVTDQQKQENKKVAKGWKASNLNKTVDSILASATRLEKEIDAETKYWEQVLAVSESGWAVCRMPQEKHTLGVRFGFAEGKIRHRIISTPETNTIQLRRPLETEVLLLYVETLMDPYTSIKESQAKNPNIYVFGSKLTESQRVKPYSLKQFQKTHQFKILSSKHGTPSLPPNSGKNYTEKAAVLHHMESNRTAQMTQSPVPSPPPNT